MPHWAALVASDRASGPKRVTYYTGSRIIQAKTLIRGNSQRAGSTEHCDIGDYSVGYGGTWERCGRTTGRRDAIYRSIDGYEVLYGFVYLGMCVERAA